MADLGYRRPKFFRIMQYAAEAERDVVDMGSGNPDWDPPEALREALREYADAPADDYQYPPSDGLVALREEIATRRNVDPERVVVTNGAGEANYLAMACALARKGSEVVLTDPVYPYYAGRTGMLGARARYAPVDEHLRVDPDAVRERASDETAVVVVNSPNNPTGAVYDEASMCELAAVAEAHDAVFVSDETYDRFDYSGRFVSGLSLDSERCVVTNSFSKSMAVTGLRVGYAVFPEGLTDAPGGGGRPLVEDARTRHMLVNVTGSRPAQHAVLCALRETGADYYARNRRVLEERVETFVAALEAAAAEYTRPDGGFYVMARFEGVPGTMANAERLIDEAGVAGMPGEAFGESRRDWFRFALVTPRVEEAARRLETYFE